MMQTRWLPRDSYGDGFCEYCRTTDRIYYVCERGLRRYFDVPKTITHISLFVTKQPAENTLPFSISSCSYKLELGGKKTHIAVGIRQFIEEAQSKGYKHLGVYYK